MTSSGQTIDQSAEDDQDIEVDVVGYEDETAQQSSSFYSPDSGVELIFDVLAEEFSSVNIEAIPKKKRKKDEPNAEDMLTMLTNEKRLWSKSQESLKNLVPPKNSISKSLVKKSIGQKIWAKSKKSLKKFAGNQIPPKDGISRSKIAFNCST